LVINLKALPFGLSEFEWTLSDDYFQTLDEAEVKRGTLRAHAALEKTSERAAALRLTLSGVLTMPCDRCLDDMQVPVESESMLMAELGPEPADDDERIVIDERDGLLDLSWIIYEQAMLALPLQRAHADGECNEQMLKAIAEHSAKAGSAEEAPETDPRWEALRRLKEEN